MKSNRRIAAVVGTIAALLLLAGCMVLPGKFASDLLLRRDGTFTFHYKGEIILAALAQGSKTAKAEPFQPEPFEQQPCTDPQTDETHDCSAAEIAQQRAKWNDEQKARKASKANEDAQNRKMAQAFMGGIDPDDPQAATAFAQRLARQEGYASVVSKGGGKFLVDYTASGRLDHDFTFPTIERLPMVMPFVSIIRRADGSVRVDAPAFSTAAANPVMPGLGAMAGAMGGMKDSSKPGAKPAAEGPPIADGIFTMRTDGQILANNTDEGPQADGTSGLSRLDWKVDARTASAPTALVKLK
ncbi:hypothetical protein NSE01_34810 [Novosphingobium sediminis]|uniref:Lipoprotein n=1 Tax=Novosphingobium sediminis TaxID=707214 RepID=A0A512APL7_9SPHN|nr:hypothetical protein [Novosphingobium sediminis]GEO01649.1 hypothetical protein NSE01_34810 [Novosphingobium sediminis]